jgi:hypothetical protein
MNYIKTFTLIIGVTLLSCVTLSKGTEQLVTINSNVDGATITLDGMIIGETPFAANIPKDKSVLIIEKEGYEAYTLALSKEIDPMFFGNIITGGTLGSITDFATGAAYTYSPANYQVELRKVDESITAFTKRFELRQYALLNMSAISIDLGNNGGNYLETLISLTELPYNQETIDLIRESYKSSYGHEIRFGHEIVTLAGN